MATEFHLTKEAAEACIEDIKELGVKVQGLISDTEGFKISEESWTGTAKQAYDTKANECIDALEAMRTALQERVAILVAALDVYAQGSVEAAAAAADVANTISKAAESADEASSQYE